MRKTIVCFWMAAFSLYGQPMVEWVTPARASNKPQTEAEAATSRDAGRKTPTPELLQPTLDAALPSYHPRADYKLTGKFKAASSDILPGLANMWIAAFRKYYPGVQIEVSPPYAGSLGAQELVKGTLDIVFVSRELRPEDLAGFRARFHYDPLSVPICGGTYQHFGFLDAIGFFVLQGQPSREAQLSTARRHPVGHAPPRQRGPDEMGGSRAERRVGRQAHSRLWRAALERLRGVRAPADPERAREARRMARRHPL